MWTVRGDGVVVGRVGRGESGYIRRELRSLSHLCRGRLDSTPVLKPFGEQVDITVSAALPTDERLCVLLAEFIGVDEPEWLWRWHELELWRYLEYCAASARKAWVGGGDAGAEPGRIELTNTVTRIAFIQSVRAIAAIAGHRIETEPRSEQRDRLEHVHHWFVTAAESLTKLGNIP